MNPLTSLAELDEKYLISFNNRKHGLVYYYLARLISTLKGNSTNIRFFVYYDYNIINVGAEPTQCLHILL